MATVTGLTAERMQEIVDESIESGAVVAGRLILTRHNATTVDAGYVIGPGANILVVTRATRPTGGALFNGLMIYETDTKQIFTYDSVATAWVYRGGMVICTAATRPTGSALFHGLKIYETDTRKELIYNGVRFDPPWAEKWGEVARVVDVTTMGHNDANEHVKTTAATTFTAVANRLYRITPSGMWRQANAAPAGCTIRIKDGTTLIEQGRLVAIPAGSDLPISFSVETALTVGSHTINLTQQSSNASGMTCICGNAPLEMLVEDVGPNGAPV